MSLDRPTLVSSLLAIAAATLAVGVIATAPKQRLALALVLGGSLLMLAGIGRWVPGSGPGPLAVCAILGLVGLGLAAAGVGLGVTSTGGFDATGEVVPGLIGIPVLTLGVAGVGTDTERMFITAGAAFVLIGVIYSALVYHAQVGSLLVAGVLGIAAWDLGEQAVNIGEQVGRTADTRRAELVHAAGTAGVAVIAVALAFGVQALQVRNISLEALMVLLGGGLLLTVALSN